MLICIELKLTKENDTLVTKIRDERHLNLRMQKKLLELLSGKKLNVDLPDKSNPVLVEISCREISEVSVIFILLNTLTFDIYLNHWYIHRIT